MNAHHTRVSDDTTVTTRQQSDGTWQTITVVAFKDAQVAAARHKAAVRAAMRRNR